MWLGKIRLFLVLLLISTGFMACRMERSAVDKKLIVIGMDGLDPTLLKQLMDGGDLPNFKSLAKKGSFSALQTSNPPQSPVAWSDFISGHNPGHHDVFDFINRNPETYLPEVGMTETRKVEKKTFRDLWTGLTGPSVQTRRKGKAFWDTLSENNIPSTIVRCPVTFPAEPLKGRLISGMGTPDLKGTQGVFTFYTTKDEGHDEIQGRVYHVAWEENKASGMISGPKVFSGGKPREVEVPVEFERIGNDKLKITVQDQSQIIEIGKWSDWFRVQFKLGFLKSVSGVFQFHLSSIEPDLQLYATAVNIDPKDPAMPISYPKSYASEVHKAIGNYHTQGMPYDTWALNEGRIDEETFLSMAYMIHQKNVEHLNMEMARFESGLLFAYFGITDLVQHMFWRYIDDKHPNKGESKDPKIKNAIWDVYKEADRVLGEIVKKMDAETTLIVLSDHGFGSFRRAVHVNSWLRENGYLVLQDEAKEGEELFQNIDWSQTKAYSVGFGGIYINQFGREKYGVVYKGAESDELKRKLIVKLKSWKDTNGASVIKSVYWGEELYSGPYTAKGPDLFIGFDKNYRASWQTALGAAPFPLIEDNMKKWGGDHLCDPSLVPGVLLSNKKFKAENPGLVDMAPTILSYFGLSSEEKLEGKSLF